MSILAICRGEQLLNVHFGGTLITHIATANEHVKQSERLAGPIFEQFLKAVAGSRSFV